MKEGETAKEPQDAAGRMLTGLFSMKLFAHAAKILQAIGRHLPSRKARNGHNECKCDNLVIAVNTTLSADAGGMVANGLKEEKKMQATRA